MVREKGSLAVGLDSLWLAQREGAYAPGRTGPPEANEGARIVGVGPDLEHSSGPADQAMADGYDGFAEAYAAETESNLLNGYYARPAILDLAGDVAGRRILDVGCGAGPLIEALCDRGAIVTGVDSSLKMLQLARRRLGDRASLLALDVRNPLPFPDGAFDDAIACLVLHYLRDWTAPLGEMRRVLTPGGRLVVAVNHPFVYKLIRPDADYFAIREYRAEHAFSGQKVVLTYWHRPLHAMTAAFTEAGFRVAVISEPPVAPGAFDAFPDVLASHPSNAFMSFLFFVLDAT